jgi:cytochrome c556
MRPAADERSKGAEDMRSGVKVNVVKLGLVALGMLATVPAIQAQEASGDGAQKAVETRQAVFKVMNFNSEQFFLMMKNKTPFDAKVVQQAATRLEMLAPMIPDTFAPDTRKANVKTKARDGIWTNMADFKAKSDELARAAAALTAAAKTGEKGATLKAAGAVGKACSGCHDNYRHS